MSAHSIVSPADQKVTFIELFFDLVFVFSVTQVANLLHQDLSWAGAGGALLVFWLVWWAWTQFTWALNAANTEHPRVQMVTLLATAVAFGMAVGVPQALGDPLWFAVPYLVVRVIGLLVYYWVAWPDPAQRRAVRTFGLASASGLLAVLLASLLGENAVYWGWALAIALDLLAAGVGGQLEGWNLHPAHFVERHGLIVIIALGETLIVAASGLAGAPRFPVAIATAVLAVAVSGALWWSYFPYVKPALEGALRRKEGRARSSMARDAFSVVHFPMLCGVIAVAVAEKEALSHPTVPFPLPMRVTFAIGLVLFVGGTALSVWRATGLVLPWRWVLALGGAAGVLALATEPWLGFGLAMVVLVAAVLSERQVLVPTAPGRSRGADLA